jgi:1-acyl-sn-glycerol-3-phosphate acyltransferase
MIIVSNACRVLLACIWTAIVGTPLVIALYARYWYGLLRAKLGRGDILDRVLEANAWLAGWVAQKFWTSVILTLAGIRLRVREIVPVDWTKGHVICANHASIFDILALVRTIPPPFRFVAKRELLNWPIIGWALRPAGQIIIDRADHSRALRSIAEAALRKIRGQVIFFVEGTRTRTGQLLPFKKGAFHFAIDNRLSVLPTAVRGSFATLAKLPWWRLRTGRQIEILFCSSVQPSALLQLNGNMAVEALLEATREQIAAALTGTDDHASKPPSERRRQGALAQSASRFSLPWGSGPTGNPEAAEFQEKHPDDRQEQAEGRQKVRPLRSAIRDPENRL